MGQTGEVGIASRIVPARPCEVVARPQRMTHLCHRCPLDHYYQEYKVRSGQLFGRREMLQATCGDAGSA